jgi:predicted transcriptional regulator
MPPRQRKPDTRSGDRHKHDPLTIRLADPVWVRLKAFAGRVGKTERAIGAEAVTEYLDRHDPGTSKDGQ